MKKEVKTHINGMDLAKNIDLTTLNIKEIDKMEDQIIIDDKELVEFIYNEGIERALVVSKEDIQKVLDLEFEFLKLKGVIEE